MTTSNTALSVSEVSRSLEHESEPILITGAPGYGSDFHVFTRAVAFSKQDSSRESISSENIFKNLFSGWSEIRRLLESN